MYNIQAKTYIDLEGELRVVKSLYGGVFKPMWCYEIQNNLYRTFETLMDDFVGD